MKEVVLECMLIFDINKWVFYLVLVAMINIVLILTCVKSLTWFSQIHNTVYFLYWSKIEF